MLDTLFQISVAFHLLAVLLFLRGRGSWALFCLLIGGIVMRFYFVGLDTFIHDWDERFHALVAKNLSHHLLEPTLIDHPILAYSNSNWWQAHIWLHKQPLFLWQMALSIRLFGANEMAVRLPSLIMTSSLILVVYKMGKALFGKSTGFIAAFIFSCFEPLLEMNSGMMGMEHNDIAFLFYVTLSIWAWIYFESTGRRQYILMMGFFSGCAVLCKWLTGVLVFSGFIFYHLFLVKDLFTRDTIKYLLLALFVCLMTFMPWQVYILLHYPVEARFEYAYNSQHFYQVVEGHAEPLWFYVDKLKEHYKYLQVFIFIGMGYSLLFWRRHKLAVAAFVMTLLIYTFFTIAETKLESYVFVVAPLCLIFLAKPVELLMRRILMMVYTRYIFGTACFFLLFYLFIDPNRIEDFHFTHDNWQGSTKEYKLVRAILFREVAGKLPPNAVIVNLENLDNIDAMFYTGYTCYGWTSQADFELLKKLNCHVVFWGDKLPDYARNDPHASLLNHYIY